MNYNLTTIYGGDRVGDSREDINNNYLILDSAINSTLIISEQTERNIFINDCCIGTKISIVSTENGSVTVNDVVHSLLANTPVYIDVTTNAVDISSSIYVTVTYRRDPTIVYTILSTSIADKMSKTISEDISAVKNFTNGLLAGGVYVNGTIPIPTDKGSGVTLGYSTAAAMHRLLAWTGSTYGKLGVGAYSDSKVSTEFNTDGTVKFNFNVTAPNIAYKSAISNYTLGTWSGSTAPYTITIPVTGATTTNIIEVVPNYDTITDAQLTALKSAQIDKITQTTGNITLYAYGTKPTVNIPIKTILRGDL